MRKCRKTLQDIVIGRLPRNIIKNTGIQVQNKQMELYQTKKLLETQKKFAYLSMCIIYTSCDYRFLLINHTF